MAGINIATALFLILFLISNFDISASKPSGFCLKLIPRDSPESPLYPGNLTQFESITRMIEFTKSKSNYVKWASSPNPNATLDPDFFALVTRDTFYYVAQFSLGSPPVNALLMLDTGGGLIWTQCQPCINCFRQSYPIYDSLASSTYQKLPCDHPLCRDEQGALYRCVNGECIFSVSYGEGSGPAKGVVSLESFTFPTDTNDNYITIDNIIFGCSNDNSNFKDLEANGQIAGIAGLSLSPDSLFMQLLDKIDSRFSYCIIPFSGNLMAPSVLRFGSDIPQLSENVKTTPYYSVPGMYYIFLHLQDISVGSRRLNFPPGTFERKSGGTLGLFIDSGAPFTHLDTNSNGVNAYQVVTNAFKNYYDSFHLQQIPEAQSPYGLTLCYKKRPDFNQYVSLTYHFQDADYILDGKYAILFYEGMFCLALIPGEGLSILGAVHQQDMRIIHDANLHAVQFQFENCANDVLN